MNSLEMGTSCPVHLFVTEKGVGILSFTVSHRPSGCLNIAEHYPNNHNDKEMTTEHAC